AMPAQDKLRISSELAQEEATRKAKDQQRAALRSRTHADERNPGYFTLKSPQGGKVLSFDVQGQGQDFREALRGRSVRPSDPLLRIGDHQGTWEIQLKIPQKHIGQI